MKEEKTRRFVLVLTLCILTVTSPASAIVAELVDLGTAASEANGLIMDWGPVQPTTSGGNWGGIATDINSFDNLCRTVWSTGNTSSAYITFSAKTLAVEIRHLDGIADESFDVYVDGVYWGSYADAGSTETWKVTGYYGAPGFTLEIRATGAAWGSFGTYGQLGIDRVFGAILGSGPIWLTAPKGGEVLAAGNTYTITWFTDSSISEEHNVLIEYSTDNCQTWNAVGTVPNTGSYNWLVPAVNSNQCRVRVSDANNLSANDRSCVFIIITTGQPPTTYQEWTFNDSDNPALPEVVANSYGMSMARLLGESDYTFGWYETYDGHTGVWHAEFLDLSLEIPNRIFLDGYKEIWLEVVYQGNLNSASVTAVPAGGKVIHLGQTVTNQDGFWKELVIGWRLEPNPQSEIICLGFSGTGSIDSVIAETICTSEPPEVLSPVVGDLEVVYSIEQCSGTKWCFNQHRSGGHVPEGGICQADDTYAWDLNLNDPCFDSDAGKPVYSVAEGIVCQTYGGCINAGGSYGQVLIEHNYHGNTWWSSYLHLKDIQVNPGQSVSETTIIGYISNTSPVPIPNHLHFVVYIGENSQSGLISFNAVIVPKSAFKMVRPAEGKIICPFHGYIKNGKLHEGIDINGDSQGKKVIAATSGKVVYVDRVEDSPAGKWVWIEHGEISKLNGTTVSKISTRYLHLDTVDPNISAGMTIGQGTAIGTVGNTGCPTTEPHLHFEVRQGDIPANLDYRATIALNPTDFVEYATRPSVFFIASCPVNLFVTDPKGLIVTKEINQIPTTAHYTEVKYSGTEDGEENLQNYDAVVVYDPKIGNYFLTVIPEPNAQADDVYNLCVTTDDQTMILVQNVPIVNIPTEPYEFESKLNRSDFDTDGDVDFADLAKLTSHWLVEDCNYPNWCEGTDLNYSGRVDFIDFALFAQNWLWEKIPADFNIDGEVEFADYAVLANQWMAGNCAESAWCDGADLNKSGSVDLYDLSEFAEQWLEGL